MDPKDVSKATCSMCLDIFISVFENEWADKRLCNCPIFFCSICLICIRQFMS